MGISYQAGLYCTTQNVQLGKIVGGCLFVTHSLYCIILPDTMIYNHQEGSSLISASLYSSYPVVKVCNIYLQQESYHQTLVNSREQ